MLLPKAALNDCYSEVTAYTVLVLTNRMGSISHHITPLVINSLGGGDTHTHTHTHTHTQAYRRSQTEVILRNQACTGLRPARAWFKNADKHSDNAVY